MKHFLVGWCHSLCNSEVQNFCDLTLKPEEITCARCREVYKNYIERKYGEI